MRTERTTRFCAWYRGGKELFRIKVPSLPYDPTFLQKNRLGALPLRTLIIGRVFKGVAGSRTGFESYNSVFCQPQFTIGKLEQTSSDTKIVIFTINEFYVVKRVFGVLRGETPKQSGAGGVMGASDDYRASAGLQFCHMAKLPKTHSGFLRAQALKQSGRRERVLGRERKPQSDGVSSLSLIKQRSLRGTSP